MISLTKIFRFDAAHAIHEYPGACANIHGHSYELHVTVISKDVDTSTYIEKLGIIYDFKDLKKIVLEVVNQFDHKLLLSKTSVKKRAVAVNEDELLVMDAEPTAENLVIYFRDRIQTQIPDTVKLQRLILWETKDSYAEWINKPNSFPL
ncbi:MAG: 6-carboxytetrahydropterin synthase [Bacteroidetes bacterium]|nr:6-carboxytetrahydropterin synthase [Bacteroidota bacterium]